MNPLVKKLRIQPGQRILILNAPDDYLPELGPLPEDVQVEEKASGSFDLVHLFVRSLAELKEFGPTALEAAEYDGLFWVSYPKKSSKIKTDISRDNGWDVLNEAGLRPVTQVSVDETWSALRFRPYEKVKKK